MQLTRTTLRLDPPLKKAAQQRALELDISFQALMQRALREYLETEGEKDAKKIVFHAKDLGVPLDNLTREDIYAD